MTATTGQTLYRTLWGNVNYSFLKPQNHLTANIAGVCLRWSFTICVFFVSIRNLRWLPQHGIVLV